MRSRGSPHRARKDVAFAVRIRVKMPPGSRKRLTLHVPFWLLTHCGREGFAHRPIDTEAGPLEVIYFRRIEDAQAFLAVLPDLELANEAVVEADASPMFPSG